MVLVIYVSVVIVLFVVVVNLFDMCEICVQLMLWCYMMFVVEIGVKVNCLFVFEGGYFCVGELLVSFDCVLQQVQFVCVCVVQVVIEQIWNVNCWFVELNLVGKVEFEVLQVEFEKVCVDVVVN